MMDDVFLIVAIVIAVGATIAFIITLITNAARNTALTGENDDDDDDTQTVITQINMTLRDKQGTEKDKKQ